jgi:hypothetical protein
MTKAIRLNDLQLILLSHAAKSDTGSALPLPAAANDPERANKELKALLRRNLLVEAEVEDAVSCWRTDDNDQRVGLLISGKGCEAIGVADGEQADATPSPKAPKTAGNAAQRGATKAETVLGLLKRSEGATLAELVEATGWLPHTTRAHLTGLRKKGLTIEKTKREDATCYRVVEAG